MDTTQPHLTHSAQLPGLSPSPLHPDGSDLMRRWYAAWNAHDPAAIATLMTDDVVYEDPGATEPRTHGREPVVEWARTAFRAVPDMHLELLDEWASPDGTVIATRFRFTATFTGPLDPPGIAPTNRPLDFYGMDRNETRDGLIARHQIFWDIAERYRILGLLPAHGSFSERIAIRWQRTNARRLRRRETASTRRSR